MAMERTVPEAPQPTLSLTQAWIAAARPKTLPASIAPVVVGTAVAIHAGGVHWLAAALALITALLLQIAANFANDALDFQRGTDTADRVGPTRITASGIVTLRGVLRATALTIGLAVLSGLYLVWRGGPWLLVVGLAAIVCVYAYTGGPFPLGYLGLGEVFVFLFFGPVAVTGTAYVQMLHLTALAWVAAIPLGALAIAILCVNNLRDLETDRAAGKHTVAVRIGARKTQFEYGAMLAIALLAPPLFWLAGWLSWWWLLTWLTLPLMLGLWRQITTRTGRPLNATLAATGRTMLLYSVLLAAALVLS
jgi:1,4-dihydroxy-2-naphthoate octaprenyltransferase